VVVLDDQAGKVDARGDVELGEGMAEMVADCVPGQEQPFGDLAVRQALGDQPRDAKLGVCQSSPPVLRRCAYGEATPDTQRTEPSADPAPVPGRSRLGVQLERPAEQGHAFLPVPEPGDRLPGVLERRGQG